MVRIDALHRAKIADIGFSLEAKCEFTVASVEVKGIMASLEPFRVQFWRITIEIWLRFLQR